jgi:hypothetical protein
MKIIMVELVARGDFFRGHIGAAYGPNYRALLHNFGHELQLMYCHYAYILALPIPRYSAMKV